MTRHFEGEEIPRALKIAAAEKRMQEAAHAVALRLKVAVEVRGWENVGESARLPEDLEEFIQARAEWLAL